MSKFPFINRELSWIEFNARVLNEAKKKTVPLLERLNFLSIVTSNFDEFFQVRVASIKRELMKSPNITEASGLTPSGLLKRISERCHEIIGEQYELLDREILPQLRENGIGYVQSGDYSPSQTAFAQSYFKNQIYPLLTPLRTDGEEFPHIANRHSYAAFLLGPREGFRVKDEIFSVKKDSKEGVAVVQIPSDVPGIIWLPDDEKFADENQGEDRAHENPDGKKCKMFTLVDDVIASFGDSLFPGYEVKESLLFKVNRDADFAVDEDAGEKFIQAMEEVLVKRQSSFPVQAICNSTSKTLSDYIKNKLQLGDDDLYCVDGPVDLTCLKELADEDFDGKENLQYPAWKHFYPADLPSDGFLWNTIRSHDVLLNVPYQSFDPVVKFIQDASLDKDVLSIKMTLYRTGSNSPIVRALEKAAQNGKQVTAFVEVKARFDEQRNISWVNELINAGVTVVYGIVNIKVHAKIALVIRRESDGLRRYVHLSTGNYNPGTAKVYQDFSIFTSNPQIASDATFFLNVISGYSAVQTMRHLFMAPITLKQKLIDLINREIQQSSPENPGLIVAKMNSLCHPEIVKKLYAASQAGVRILLNIRGICTLVPGVEGVSENIRVVSTIGRYLEHSRICYFQNGGEEELFLSSADWMERNLDRRIELMFPVTDKQVFQKVKETLMMYFEDNTQTHLLQNDGTWIPATTGEGENPLNVQEQLYQSYRRINDSKESKPKLEFEVRRG